MPKKTKSKSKPKSRSISKKQRSALITIAIILVVVIYAQYQGIKLDQLFTELTERGGNWAKSVPAFLTAIPPQSDASVTPSAPKVTTTNGPWWDVYFTDPIGMSDPDDWQNSIEGRLVDRINAAQTSIHIASFEFDRTPVAEALIEAHNRGVDVRWVTDDEYGLLADEEPDHGQFEMLKDAGIEIRSDDRTALMHNKFWIFDNQTVWTGSTNITKNGIYVQDNNTIVIQSPELAAIYEAEFQEMWDGQFGPTSPSQLSDQSVNVNGSLIQVIFTSEDGALEQAIIPIVNSATSKISFLAFSFTDYPLAKAMMDRAQNGVEVSGIFDKTQAGGEGSEIGTLFCAGLPVREDGNPQFMHNKFIVVDERYVITGSLNYSTNAEESNDENVLIIDNPEIAKLYMAEFENVYGQGTEPEGISCK